MQGVERHANKIVQLDLKYCAKSDRINGIAKSSAGRVEHLPNVPLDRFRGHGGGRGVGGWCLGGGGHRFGLWVAAHCLECSQSRLLRVTHVCVVSSHSEKDR